MNGDRDVIRVLERRRRAIERGLVEVPLQRCQLPNELRKIVRVLVVAGAATFRGKINLVPPLKFRAGGSGARWEA